MCGIRKLLKKKKISYGNIFNIGSNNEIITGLISEIQNVTGINKKIQIEKKEWEKNQVKSID